MVWYISYFGIEWRCDARHSRDLTQGGTTHTPRAANMDNNFFTSGKRKIPSNGSCHYEAMLVQWYNIIYVSISKNGSSSHFGTDATTTTATGAVVAVRLVVDMVAPHGRMTQAVAIVGHVQKRNLLGTTSLACAAATATAATLEGTTAGTTRIGAESFVDNGPHTDHQEEHYQHKSGQMLFHEINGGLRKEIIM